MPESDGDDLAAMLARLGRLLADQEAPILRRHGVSMWEYVILSSLDAEQGSSQAEISRRSRRDTTRLIAHLDELERRGLLSRVVDPADRRRRLVRLTGAGATELAATRDEIRSMEREFIGHSGGSLDDLRSALEDVLAGAPEVA